MNIINKLRQHIISAAKTTRGVKRLNRLGIDIVHGCQLRCIGCPNSLLQKNIYFMNADDFDNILKNINVHSVKRLRLFNFGEPLLHPAIPDILAKIPNQAYRIRTVEISTNAQHHDFPMLAEIFRRGVVNRFAVSCDGDGTKEDYERLRPPAKYEKLIEFFIKAKEYRDRYSPNTVLITRTISNTHASQKRWLDLLLPLGWTPEFRNWITLPESYMAKNEGKPIQLKKGCYFMREKYLYVDTDGTVVPCCVYPRPFELGNLKEHKYTDIVKSRQRKLMLRILNTKKENMAVCSKCPY